MKKLLARLILLNCLDFDTFNVDSSDLFDDSGLDSSFLDILEEESVFSDLSSVLLDIGGVCRLLDVVLEELLGNGASSD